jgi:hypothetical protein
VIDSLALGAELLVVMVVGVRGSLDMRPSQDTFHSTLNAFGNGVKLVTK